MAPKFHLHIDRVPPEMQMLPKGTLAYQQKSREGRRRSILIFDMEKRIIDILNGTRRAASHFTFIARGPAWFEKLDPECRVIVTYGTLAAFPANIIVACEGRVLGVEKKLIKNLGNFELSRNLGFSKKRKLVEQMELADFVSIVHFEKMPREITVGFLRSMHIEPAE